MKPDPKNVPSLPNVPAPNTLTTRNAAAKKPGNVLAARKVAMLKRERKLLEQFDESLSW